MGRRLLKDGVDEPGLNKPNRPAELKPRGHWGVEAGGGSGGSGALLGPKSVSHHVISSGFNRWQVPERVGAYAGSNKSISVEHHTLTEKQLREALPLIERRLHPEVRGTGQNALREGQDAFYVERFEFAGVSRSAAA